MVVKIFLLYSGSKEAHQKQKELKLERKAHKPNSETIRDTKKIWEQLRQNKLKSEEKQKLMTQMMGLIRDRVQDVRFFPLIFISSCMHGRHTSMGVC